MNKENHFIQLMSQKRTRIGDDGALVDGLVYSKDIFFENIHFKREWLSYYQIGYKAMIVNISDAIAMNADPKYALVGIAIPKSLTITQMGDLALGLRECASEYGVEIIGGDTISNPKLDISITIVSQSVRPLVRSGLQVGDLIAHTGILGEALRHLRYLMAGGTVHSKSRFVRPILRQRFINRSRRYLRCGMDISDGLFSDAEKLTSINKMDIQWTRRLCKSIGCSGEEYEMLIAFSPRYKKAIEKIAHLTRTPLTIVGKATRGKFRNRCKRHHF